MCLTNKVFLFPVLRICYLLKGDNNRLSILESSGLYSVFNIEFQLKKFLSGKKKQKQNETKKKSLKIAFCIRLLLIHASQKNCLVNIPVVSILAQSYNSYLQHCDLVVPRIQVFSSNLILFNVVFRMIQK